MNETTRYEGDYGCGETKLRRAFRQELPMHGNHRPHTGLSAKEMNALMQTWRPKPHWYRAWENIEF